MNATAINVEQNDAATAEALADLLGFLGAVALCAVARGDTRGLYALVCEQARQSERLEPLVERLNAAYDTSGDPEIGATLRKIGHAMEVTLRSCDRLDERVEARLVALNRRTVRMRRPTPLTAGTGDADLPTSVAYRATA